MKYHTILSELNNAHRSNTTFVAAASEILD